ncbi:MAG: lytic transglycosylase domain-containing protein [Flavobacteriaceae bacterium]|nr:lytic transglycosylase domain-containing protein [Flavobacteriaceae bacterium]
MHKKPLFIFLTAFLVVVIVATSTPKSNMPVPVKVPTVPTQLDFAGEKVPLFNADVYERMDRELLVNTFWHSNSILMLKRAEKYFPIIEPILASYNIPDDFKYLAVIESGLMNATSPAGAKGFWQLMRATAREYGLEVNSNVDERLHLELSTKVACTYLNRAYEKFGSWTLAAAAYNAGRSRVSRYLDYQQVDNYYDLLFGEETGRYVFRILAAKLLFENPEVYGFDLSNQQKYTPNTIRLVDVDTAIVSLANFASDFGMNYKELKLLNPWLLEPHLNNKSRKPYRIAVKND